LMFVLVDPKQRAFGRLGPLPHLVWPVISDVNDAADALLELVHTMEARDRAGSQAPRLILVIDELADLIQVGGKSVSDALTRLTQRGREAGLHVIACTQKPTSQVLGPLMKANFPTRLVGRVTSPEDARVAAGIGGSGAEKLARSGEFVVVAAGTIQRFQAALATTDDIHSLIEHIKHDGPGQAPDQRADRHKLL
jgi:S-DNA-T family DNA segregation ATPase FtsK/SpoIIIE